MSTGNWTEADVLRINAQRMASHLVKQPTKSKYRNVKCVVDGQKFDSRHESEIWLQLRARENAGEISDLTRQCPLDLCAPDWQRQPEGQVVVARYIADYRWLDLKTGEWVYADAKSKATRTQIYRLKAKWLFLQSGIEIVEM